MKLRNLVIQSAKDHAVFRGAQAGKTDLWRYLHRKGKAAQGQPQSVLARLFDPIFQLCVRASLGPSADVLMAAVPINVGPDYYDVRSYGAKGDGVTDDRTAILAAFAACPTGGTVYFPAGYNFRYGSGGGFTNNTGKRMLGGGQWPDNLAKITFDGNTGLDKADVVIQNLELDGQEDRALITVGADSSYLQLKLVGGSKQIWAPDTGDGGTGDANNVLVRDIVGRDWGEEPVVSQDRHFINLKGPGANVLIENVRGYQTTSRNVRGIEIENGMHNVTVRKAHIKNCAGDYALDAHSHTTNETTYDITFEDCFVEDCAKGPSANGPNTRDVRFLNCTAEGCGQTTFRAPGTIVVNFTMKDCTTYIQVGKDVQINGVTGSGHTGQVFQFVTADTGDTNDGPIVVRDVDVSVTTTAELMTFATDAGFTYILLDGVYFTGSTSGTRTVLFNAGSIDGVAIFCRVSLFSGKNLRAAAAASTNARGIRILDCENYVLEDLGSGSQFAEEKIDSTGRLLNMALAVDTISERTAAAGVTIDGVLLKDSMVGATYLPTAAAGTAGIIPTTGLTNAMVAAAAAIAYSKLNLTNSIVNADIAAAAAIAYSKLNLAASIVNADVAVGAAIAKSKLAALAIVDADVDGAAAIAKSKIATAGTWAAADLPSAATGAQGAVLKAATVAAVGAMQTPDAPAVYTEGAAQAELDKLKANDDELKTKLDALLTALKNAGSLNV